MIPVNSLRQKKFRRLDFLVDLFREVSVFVNFHLRLFNKIAHLFVGFFPVLRPRGERMLLENVFHVPQCLLKFLHVFRCGIVQHLHYFQSLFVLVFIVNVYGTVHYVICLSQKLTKQVKLGGTGTLTTSTHAQQPCHQKKLPYHHRDPFLHENLTKKKP
ncbi:unnamed protein product [Trypanosoma congolense IL3000]|uniref:WGS project CAEQ00000000 data, annotated contig 1827 n=1 Tax=Trypanosoma congolense (strain IL3000) TaxID=1068625 RepID=F9W962_TRYCI|nr:unnamed protein product [Trypanosoma congolense IL3000]